MYKRRIKLDEEPAAMLKAVPPSAGGLTKCTRGKLAELVVAADLMWMGLHVFMGISHNGPCDLTVINPNNHSFFTVEVKFSKNGGKGAINGFRRKTSANILAFVNRNMDISYHDTKGANEEIAAKWLLKK